MDSDCVAQIRRKTDEAEIVTCPPGNSYTIWADNASLESGEKLVVALMPSSKYADIDHRSAVPMRSDFGLSATSLCNDETVDAAPEATLIIAHE